MLNIHEAAQRNVRVAEMRAYRAYDEAYLGRGIQKGHVAGGITLPVLASSRGQETATNKPMVKRVGGKPVRVKLANIKTTWPARDELRAYRLRDQVYTS
jgi:hypothetical protein